METGLRKVLIYTALGLLLAVADSAAQDPFLSQQHASSLYLNPAFAGTSFNSRLAVAYRNHFPSLGSSYVTYYASWDQYVELIQGGLGFNLMHDVQEGGVIKLISADAIYTYSLVVTQDLTISAGIQASYSYRSLSTDGLVFSQELTGVGSYRQEYHESITQGKGYPDFAVGFLGISRFAYAGVAVHHLNRPNMSFSSMQRVPLPWKFSAHGGIIIPVYERRFGKEAVRLNPNAVVLYQGGQNQFNYGLDIWTGPVFAGLMLRQNIPVKLSAAALCLGYSNEYIRLAYSYDFNILDTYSQVRNAGAHELGFALKIEQKSAQRARSKAIKFPIF